MSSLGGDSGEEATGSACQVSEHRYRQLRLSPAGDRWEAGQSALLNMAGTSHVIT